MGRQPYLVRLALGRSAFEAPLRDENGDFVLGGLSHEFDDSRYVQQWDERGHPVNQQSTTQARKFRKAQNEVLQACGVIVRRDAESKTEWETKPPTRKLDVVLQENKHGLMLKGLDRLNGVLASWWATSLRRRFMTFGLNSQGLYSTLISDLTHFGLSQVLIAGLPAFFASSSLKMVRYYTRDPEAGELVNYLDPYRKPAEKQWLHRIGEIASQFGYFALEFPIEVLSLLQNLCYLTAENVVSPHFFVPFAAASPIFLPRLPLEFGRDSLTNYTLACLGTPIALALLRDYLQLHIGFRTYALLRQIISKPTRPDLLSAKAADADEFVDETSIPGVGRRIGSFTHLRYFGPSTFWDALPLAFPIFRKPKPKLSIGSNDGRLVLAQASQRLSGIRDHDSEEAMRAASTAVLDVFDKMGIDLEEENYIDLDKWARELVYRRLDSVTSLDPEDAFLIAEVDQIAVPDLPGLAVPTTTPDNESQESGGREGGVLILEHGSDQVSIIPNTQPSENSEPFTATVPLQNLLEALDDTPPLPPTPETGIRRATSLVQTTPRPVRRLTEVDQSEDEGIPLHRAHGQRRRPGRRKPETCQYRVSRLSTFAADSLAWHASAIITSLLLLPLDSVYFRILTIWSQSKTSHAYVRRTVLPIDVWFGGERSLGGYLQYSGALVLCLGLETLARGIVWRVGSAMAVHYSEEYSWGLP